MEVGVSSHPRWSRLHVVLRVFYMVFLLPDTRRFERSVHCRRSEWRRKERDRERGMGASERKEEGVEEKSRRRTSEAEEGRERAGTHASIASTRLTSGRGSLQAGKLPACQAYDVKTSGPQAKVKKNPSWPCCARGHGGFTMAKAPGGPPEIPCIGTQ